MRRSLAATAAALLPLLASAGRAAASCVVARTGAASVSTGCAPDQADPMGGSFGPYVAVADGHPDPMPAYVPVYEPVYVPVYVPVHVPVHPTPVPKAAKAPRDAAAQDRPRNDDQATGDGADDPAADIAIELDCAANPETTRVTNDGDAPVTVRSIEPRVGTDAGEPIAREDVIRPGRSITYQSGDGAEGRNDLGPELYLDDDRDEGVRLDTSGGEFETFCFAS